MKVYVVQEHYGDYDEGHDTILGVYATYADADAACQVADAAMKAAQEKYAQTKAREDFLWGSYHNYFWDVSEYDVQ